MDQSNNDEQRIFGTWVSEDGKSYVFNSKGGRKMTRKNWLALLVTVLAMGITVVDFNGCSKNMDRRLNGTWALDKENPIIMERGGGDSIIRVTFENGNIVVWYSDDGDIHIRHKGTYITNDSNIIIQHTFSSFLIKLLNQSTTKYTVSGKKLKLYGGVGDTVFGSFGNVFRDIDPLELIQVNKNTNVINNDKKPVPTVKSSGKLSAFPGRWQLIEGEGDATDVELFKDGTGTADGNGITWKIENGRFHILHPFYTFSAFYKVTGKTITFTQDDGKVIKYQKK